MINEIFKTLNTVVQNQGYIIDHIRDNVENVVINVENAEVELNLQKKKQDKTTWCIQLLFWIILIIILIIIVKVIL